MKVLICADESKSSEDAFLWYLNNLHKEGNVFTLLHVGDQPQLPKLVFYEKAVFPYEEFEEIVERSRKKIDDVRARFFEIARNAKSPLNDDQFVCEPHNKPGEVIVATATKLGADMVLLGTRRQGTVRRTVLGSVSDYVVHHSTVPVTIYQYV